MTVEVSVHPRRASVGVTIIGAHGRADVGVSPWCALSLAGRLVSAAARTAVRRR